MSELIEIPLCTADLPAVGGRIGPDPEHFVVDEQPLYQPSGEGAHLYVRLRKRSMTTAQLLRTLSRVSGVRDRDIGYAGLKDKHAVTSQWFSLPELPSAAPEAWELPPGVEVLEVSRHNNKLRTGHLRGNRFAITLVDIDDAAAARAPAIVERARAGVLNAFGPQRFGEGGQSLDEAMEWLASGRRPKTRFLAKLYPSVIQAELFNRYLVARQAVGFEQLLLGEVVRLDGSGKLFVVDDVEAELPRLLAQDIHLTGPMIGPKGKAAVDAARRLEEQCIAELGLDRELVARLGNFAPGTRRDLLMFPLDLRWDVNSSREMLLQFFLPAGAYATVLIAEFCQPR